MVVAANIRAFFTVILVTSLVSGCTFFGSKDYQSSRYHQRHDSAPVAPQAVDHVQDAVPTPEPRTMAGNKSPYRVNGRTYHVLDSEIGYQGSGIASWYGQKFHGHATSNGEIYDMYAMTAAHKTLPIPSYVTVKNLANGLEVIVRVNDRGPFHPGRVIDLSYAAAHKLNMLDQGTANVVVTAIDPVAWQRANGGAVAAASVRAQGSSLAMLPANTYLQAGAFSSSQAAEQLRLQLSQLLDWPVTINPPSQGGGFYRVRIGPVADNLQVADIRQRLQAENIAEPHLVYD